MSESKREDESEGESEGESDAWGSHCEKHNWVLSCLLGGCGVWATARADTALLVRKRGEMTSECGNPIQMSLVPRAD